MDAGLAAILGAVVGACGTAVAAGVTGYFSRSQMKLQMAAQTRQSERQIRADHAAQLREPRRQAYADYAAEISSKLDSLWRIIDGLSQNPPRREMTPEQLRFWDTTSSRPYERVLMEGPEDVAYAAARLGEATEQLAHLALGLFAAETDSTSPEHVSALAEIQTAMNAAKQARRNFRLVVMAAIRADGRVPEEDQVRVRAVTMLDREQRQGSSADGGT